MNRGRQWRHQLLNEDTKRRFDDGRFWLKRNRKKCVFGALFVAFIVIVIEYQHIWTSGPGSTPSTHSVTDFPCDPNEEYARFKHSGGTRAGVMACPDNSEWLRLFAASDPNPAKTAVFIGCNKGVDAVDIFAMFDNALTPFSSSSWRDAVKSFVSDGGACNQINKSPGFDRRQYDLNYDAVSPTVYCVEPMKANIELLNKCQDQTGIDSSFFHIEQFAVGMPEKGQTTIGFPDGGAGTEYLGVVKSGGIQVPYTSLDALCGTLDKVDILSIDTEGNDPHVMFAGVETLKKTRYLEFEVHRDIKDAAWGSVTLQSVIEFLDNLQFDCFWVNGKGELFKITQCWNDQYEADSHCWSNVVCAKRGDKWHEILFDHWAIQYNVHHPLGTSATP